MTAFSWLTPHTSAIREDLKRTGVSLTDSCEGAPYATVLPFKGKVPLIRYSYTLFGGMKSQVENKVLKSTQFLTEFLPRGMFLLEAKAKLRSVKTGNRLGINIS